MSSNGSLYNVLRFLDQVIGDLSHREDWIWAGGVGKRCRNIVPKPSQVEGALCL